MYLSSYNTLLDDNTRFSKCPGGTEADEFILAAAKKDKLQIITNDRYRDHRKKKHAWLKNYAERAILLKSAVITSPKDKRGYLNVIDLGINIPIESNLELLLEKLELSIKDVTLISINTDNDSGVYLKDEKQKKEKSDISELKAPVISNVTVPIDWKIRQLTNEYNTLKQELKLFKGYEFQFWDLFDGFCHVGFELASFKGEGIGEARRSDVYPSRRKALISKRINDFLNEREIIEVSDIGKKYLNKTLIKRYSDAEDINEEEIIGAEEKFLPFRFNLECVEIKYPFWRVTFQKKMLHIFAKRTTNFIFTKRSKWGIIREDGEVCLDFIYDDISPMVNGYAFVKRNNLWGCIDVHFSTMFQCIFDKKPSSFRNRRAIAYTAKEGYFLINEFGVKSSMSYGHCERIPNQNGYFIVQQFGEDNSTGNYGIINIIDQMIIPCIYHSLRVSENIVRAVTESGIEEIVAEFTWDWEGL